MKDKCNMKHLKLFEGLLENNEQTFPLSPNRILNVMSGSMFEKWYDKDFIDYIEGTDGCKSRQEILEDIKNVFK